MTESTPLAGPADTLATNGTGDTSGASMPSVVPPSVASDASSGDIMTSVAPPPALEGTAPALRIGGGATSAITAWQNNKRVTGLWSINQNRNSWIHVDGIGWKKLANNSDSAIESLTMLGAHAREKASSVNYREESDGMVYEMYVW